MHTNFIYVDYVYSTCIQVKVVIIVIAAILRKKEQDLTVHQWNT